ncbi:imidazolonepropionase [Mycobacterium sp. KBS0706]|uniref:imidazolonepropionase n=1 Tax=Mycobacterium sp. KBS0706 TaxID=2578109 RepID=UPI00110F7EA6|nr:imidazolonepropionase [Mycobacterium sp. KBS0706]TSD87962.1 imidazolonepropionase [Mycobacterium sp. KBS0706]
MWDRLWINARLATMDGEGYGAIPEGAIATQGDRIAWVGRQADLPGAPDQLAAMVEDAAGAWVTPGLIDCHTHLVHGGDRAREFAMRLHGASYEEIARAGGGIVSTVAATRAAGEEDLLASARKRLDALAAEGVTTVEIKSGYGLDLATEAKMLRVAGRLGRESGLRVRRSFLGAHAVPPEDRGQPERYLDRVVEEMLPAIARDGLADAVDAFGEKIAFSPVEVERVFRAAKALGLPVKLHADQLSDQDGAALAARFGALSADHLEYTSESGAKEMGRAGTVAVLLPGAFYFLRETQLPPVAAFRRHGVPMALATDNNPGTSPATSLLLMLNMGCTLFRLTPEEALAGVTRNAARALGLAEECGRLVPGLAADLAFWDVADPAELSYRIAYNPCRAVIRAGRQV